MNDTAQTSGNQAAAGTAALGSTLPVAGFADFPWPRGNLYVVPVPLPAGQLSAAIESGFDAATLAIKVDGKSFCADKTFDEKLNFGKMVVAHKVVTPNADTINFKGFTQLLTNISKAIADHRKRYFRTP